MISKFQKKRLQTVFTKVVGEVDDICEGMQQNGVPNFKHLYVMKRAKTGENTGRLRFLLMQDSIS